MTDNQENHSFEVNRSQSPSINSQSYAIPMPHEIIEQLSECSSTEGSDGADNDNTSNENRFLDSIVPETSNLFLPEAQDPGSMFDVSKYIFESLAQAIDCADFCEAISLQTKTSAIINSKSLELKQLLQTTKVRLTHFRDRFENGIQTSKTIRQNLQHSKDRIDQISAVIATRYPIEFNQAKEKIVERNFDALPNDK
ncbi:hypothetical protein HG535_0E01370 [Zygotorulaspora mrakii]|uniref:Biogenesis of lysosome-related organelles complex 1 subunit KXD1 n=1 Tax=Zygotorulaspora mrakii TaxID=42260 RepID=A0A7H9B3I1_ZYGMR|nr:uncharacterized protein HG535_0E01370 [Zygotorulaspora mrakii]QLG73053.1 hypothetical protein HG535_0E01370 [Zygotorulaspora mrakii]